MNRAQISRTVLVVGLIALFFQLAPHVPRDTKLDLRLGDKHTEVVALELSLSVPGTDELLRSVTLRFPQGAPRVIKHTARLPTGAVDLSAQLTLRDGRTIELRRPFRTPEEGLSAVTGLGAAVRIDLSE